MPIHAPKFDEHVINITYTYLYLNIPTYSRYHTIHIYKQTHLELVVFEVIGLTLHSFF